MNVERLRGTNITHLELKPIDVEVLRRLSKLTNVIPLIAKADLHTGNISSLKSTIAADLHSANIRYFQFAMVDTDSVTRVPLAPYTVSSAPSSDTENMDASLLMSPDYVQPLIPTDLAFLVMRIFEWDTIGWLRHSAALKCLQWRNDAASASTSILRPSLPLGGKSPFYPRMGMSTIASSMSSSSTSQALVSYNSGGAPSYTMARVTDHTQREEKLAQVRLAKWAGELQRSLQNERLRYEALAKGERAIWLEF